MTLRANRFQTLRSSIAGLLLIVGFAAVPDDLLAGGGPFVQEDGKGQIWIYGGGGGTGSYYDVNGTLRGLDTIGTRFMALTFGFGIEYGFGNGLELNLDVPIGYYAISSESRFPDRSILAPAWIGVGVTWQALDGTFPVAISSQLMVPPGFHDGIYDDPEHPTFLSDGFLQWGNSVAVGYNAPGGWGKLRVGYNWRGEEPADEIFYTIEGGLTRVKGTGIFVGIDGVFSTADVSEPLRPFYAGTSGSSEERRRRDGGRGIFRTIDREEYLAVRPGAFVDIAERFTITGQYAIRLFGKNTLTLPGGYLGIGYRF